MSKVKGVLVKNAKDVIKRKTGKLETSELQLLSNSDIISYWRKYHSNEPNYLEFLRKYVFKPIKPEKVKRKLL